MLLCGGTLNASLPEIPPLVTMVPLSTLSLCTLSPMSAVHQPQPTARRSAILSTPPRIHHGKPELSRSGTKAQGEAEHGVRAAQLKGAGAEADADIHGATPPWGEYHNFQAASLMGSSG